MLGIRKCQATQCAKHKNITDSFKSWYIKLLVDDGIEFLCRQKITVTLCLVKTDFGKWVIGNPFVDQREPGYFLQVLQILDSRILGTALLYLNKVFKVQDEFMVQFLQRNIFQIVLVLKHFFQISNSPFVSENRSFHIITVYKFPVLLIVLTEYF